MVHLPWNEKPNIWIGCLVPNVAILCWSGCDLELFLGYIDGLMQERRNFIASTLELRLSCTNPSIFIWPPNRWVDCHKMKNELMRHPHMRRQWYEPDITDSYQDDFRCKCVIDLSGYIDFVNLSSRHFYFDRYFYLVLQITVHVLF